MVPSIDHVNVITIGIACAQPDKAVSYHANGEGEGGSKRGAILAASSGISQTKLFRRLGPLSPRAGSRFSQLAPCRSRGRDYAAEAISLDSGPAGYCIQYPPALSGQVNKPKRTWVLEAFSHSHRLLASFLRGITLARARRGGLQLVSLGPFSFSLWHPSGISPAYRQGDGVGFFLLIFSSFSLCIFVYLHGHGIPAHFVGLGGTDTKKARDSFVASYSHETGGPQGG